MASKIYTRATQSKGKGRKPKDEKARKRNTIVNFRVTPEEKARIDARIAMTGLSKAEFFIESCLYQTILVKGNIRTFREYERSMEQIAGQMQKGTKPEEMDPELLEEWKTILEILDRLFGKGR